MLARSWLSVHQCPTEIQRVMKEKERVALLLCEANGEHSWTSVTVPHSQVNRERLDSQTGMCDMIKAVTVWVLLQGFKRVGLLTRLGCVQGLRWASQMAQW